ncbi:unnamed protein product [Pieris macdunnoughi]|uniref:Sulfotransferase domain-containing protein n=1 Tax=Pieris macdunnoughi TaxID=345717 RepID=A0A821RQF8_9NEOP|nr:unnamed protein product [Pieris macdunnoughi]
MSTDLPATLRRLFSFLGKQYTDTQIQGLCDHLSVEKFKKNDAVNGEKLYNNIQSNLDKREFKGPQSYSRL